MELFTSPCPQCGHSNPKQAKFCAHCGAALAGGKRACGACGTLNRSDAVYCKECGRPLAESAAPELSGSRWARRESDFAARIEAQDLPGLFQRGIQVEMGANAVLLEDGVNQGVLPPGSYTLDSLEKRLTDWIVSGRARPVTVLLVDVMPAEMEFHLGGIFTSDPIGVGASVRLQAQVEEPARFLAHMLHSREQLSKEDLRLYLYPEVAQIVDGWVRRHTVQELAQDLSLKEQLELALDEGLKATFAQTGLKFLNIRTLELNMEHLERVKGIQSQYTLQATQAEAEAAGKKRLLDVMGELNLTKIAEETQKVEDEERRAELYRRMRQAVLSQKMDEVRSDADFETFLDETDRQKLLREKERADLLRAWKEEAEDHDLKRGFLLQKLEVEQGYEVRKAQLDLQTGLDQAALEHELELARKRSDFEFEQKRKIIEAEFYAERERERIELEKQKAQMEIDRLEEEMHLKSDAEAARLGIELLAKMKEVKRRDEQERRLIEREDEIARMKAKLDDDLARFDLEERRMRLEMERIKELSQLGVEALISVSTPEQAQVLADLKKQANLKDMSEEQILAAAAANSPDVARALQEKFRALAEGSLSERERKLYTDLMVEHKDELNRMNEMWAKMAEREKETARYSLDRMAETAQAFARGSGAAPIIVTPQGTLRAGGQPSSEPDAQAKNCPKCGRFVPASARFCEHCGHKFEGVA